MFDVPEDGHHNRVRSKVDGLSVNRLTLLGRIHMARVVIESLSLDAVDVIPVRDRQQNKRARGKPPTPTRTVDKNKRCCDD